MWYSLWLTHSADGWPTLHFLCCSLLSVVKAHIRKGHALLGMKNTVKAMHAFETALELDPNSVVSGTAPHLLSILVSRGSAGM